MGATSSILNITRALYLSTWMESEPAFPPVGVDTLVSAGGIGLNAARARDRGVEW